MFQSKITCQFLHISPSYHIIIQYSYLQPLWTLSHLIKFVCTVWFSVIKNNFINISLANASNVDNLALIILDSEQNWIWTKISSPDYLLVDVWSVAQNCCTCNQSWILDLSVWRIMEDREDYTNTEWSMFINMRVV